MSTIASIAVEPPILLRPSMRIGEVLSKLGELRIREAPVIDDDGLLIGILSYRAILSKGVGRDTRVSTVMDPPYAINANESIDKAVASIVSWKARDIPIVDSSSRVVGYINRAMVLRHLYSKGLIPSESVDKVMTSPAITIQEWESIARARWLMLRNAFSRLPVVDRHDKAVGVITLSDIVERLYRIKLSRRRGYEWIESEESFLAAPVSDFMSSPPIAIASGSAIVDAVELMLSKNISGLPVVTGDNQVVGVLSSLDILRRYVEGFAVVYPIEAKISRAVKTYEQVRPSIERIVNSYLASFSKYVNILDFKISVKEPRKAEETETKETRRRFEVATKIVTDIGSFTAKTVCWDLPTCVREAMNILEKRLRKQIEKRLTKRSGHRKTER